MLKTPKVIPLHKLPPRKPPPNSQTDLERLKADPKAVAEGWEVAETSFTLHGVTKK